MECSMKVLLLLQEISVKGSSRKEGRIIGGKEYLISYESSDRKPPSESQGEGGVSYTSVNFNQGEKF